MNALIALARIVAVIAVVGVAVVVAALWLPQSTGGAATELDVGTPTAGAPTPTEAASASPTASPTSTRPPQPSAPPLAADAGLVGNLATVGLVVVSGDTWVLDTAAVDALLDGTAVVDASAIGYSQDAFEFWTDPDGNGCDARNDVLARDLVDVTLDRDMCTVLTGTLDDPYTGATIAFVRGVDTSHRVQIDHIVARSSAWTGGANAWTAAEREAFANDPLGLIAVDGPTNTGKRDRGPSEWLPERAGTACLYVANYAAVLDRYDLATTTADLEAMRAVNAGC